MTTLDLSLGALELGILLSTVLYGMATLQFFDYTQHKFRDPHWLRLMVGFVWILETIHTIFTWIILYTCTVTHYGQPSILTDTPWALAFSFTISGLVGSIVQSFFAYRVRVLSGRLIIPVIVWCGAVLRIALGVTDSGLLFETKTLPHFFHLYIWVANAPFIVNVLIDLLNTVALCFYLSRQRCGAIAIERVVDKLILFAVETGLITSLCGIAVVLCGNLLPQENNLVYMGLVLIYPKLFSNSLFTALNARRTLRHTRTTTSVWHTGPIAQSIDIESGVALSFAVDLSRQESNTSSKPESGYIRT